tara:strand:+ start:153 stop:962 length:810 start_codon:yes stop_codon:yes gene_type:complete
MILFQVFIIIVLFIITFINRVIKKQYFLFNWYCKKYYNLEDKLTKKELKYIYNIFNLSPIELLNKTMDGKRLSFITYSHQLKDNDVISKRFAIGSIMLPNLSLFYALDIFKDRNITLPNYLFKKNYIFGGLGWDFNKDLFKVYFRCLNSNFIKNKDSLHIINEIKKTNKKKINRILKDYKTKKYWKEGLISFTYKNNKLYEKKLYLYPKYSYKNITYMLSDKRGIIIQEDIINKNNSIQNDIIDDYKKINFELDTYTKDKDTITMYFPK